MKKITVVFFLSLITIISYSQQNEIAIIPEPVNLVKKTGFFQLKDKLTVSVSNHPDMKQVLDQLQKITTATGIPVQSGANSATAQLALVLNKKAKEKLGTEGYQLT